MADPALRAKVDSSLENAAPYRHDVSMRDHGVDLGHSEGLGDPEQTSRKLAANGNPDLSDAPTALHPGIDQHERQERGPTTVWGQ